MGRKIFSSQITTCPGLSPGIYMLYQASAKMNRKGTEAVMLVGIKVANVSPVNPKVRLRISTVLIMLSV